jgi:hypothetical protein
MRDKGNLSTRSYWGLLKQERSFGQYDMGVTEIRAEIDRRHKKWKMWAVGICATSVIVAAILHSK